MPQLQENAFTFESRGLPADTFTVARFTGEEGLSTLYKFEILLVSEREDVDLEAVLQNPATFTIKEYFTGGQDLPFHGIISSFEQLHQVNRYVFYRAELRPKAWWLTLTHHNQVFLDKTASQFLENLLEDGGLDRGLDFELRTKEAFPAFAYVCQYGESHFDFFSRWTEFGGWYYWFEQGETSEKLICTDSLIAHIPLSGRETFTYSPPSGLDAAQAGQVIKAFTLKQSPVPRKVMVRDYNYMRPSLDMKGQADVRDKGRGEIYLWGDHFRSQKGGDYLARVRAERFLCREKVFRGVSTIPAVRPGYLFTLAKHYRQDFNGLYLTTQVRHEGGQERWLVGGLGVHGIKDKDSLFYRNTFDCIPETTQFRPARVTEKPRISGTVTARIDAAGSGQYAELDEHGRYKVILPFDLSGREGGKASTWLRMSSPYAGEDYGMHFPLHKGTEVLLSFEEGDIDRPIIVGAVHNPEKPNLVTDRNAHINAITTAGGSELVMSDEHGKNFIGMKLPGGGATLGMYSSGEQQLDNPNDPPLASPPPDKSKTTLFNIADQVFLGAASNATQLVVGTDTKIFGGNSTSLLVGASGRMLAGLNWNASLAQSLSASYGPSVSFTSSGAFSYCKERGMLGEEKIALRAGLAQLSQAKVKTLKKCFWTAISVALANTADTIAFMDSLQQSEKYSIHGNEKIAQGILGAASGALLLVDAVLMYFINKTINDIQTAQSAQCATNIVMSKNDGIKMTVDNSVGNNHGKFLIEAGNSKDAKGTAIIEIERSGDHILLGSKNQNHNILITNDIICINNLPNGGSVTIDEQKVEISKPDQSKIVVDSNGVNIQKENGAKLSLQKDNGKFGFGDSNEFEVHAENGCTIKSSHISLIATEKGQIKASKQIEIG